MDIRAFAERLSRRIVFRRRLPAAFGRLPIYVTPEAGLRYWSRMERVDPVLYSMAEELVTPGSVVWDVGANVGLFSWCAAARAGQSGAVLAIEPDFWLAQLILRTSRGLDRGRYGCAEVKVLCAAVSAANGISELEVAERARASNHLIEAAGSTQASAVRYSQATVSLTLDYLLDYFPAPTVLKIDVETHEASALRGAKKILEKVRPTIWCEVARENSPEVTRLLTDAGYELYGAETNPHLRAERAWFHTLAVPVSSH
jgi:FkbM family methyltransferase